MGRYKIGDRVRLVKDGVSTTGAVGKLATIDSWDGRVMSGKDYLLKIDPPYDYKTLSVSPEYTRATEDCFVAVADSNSNESGLRIEAGKYYRTRDGRKVRPMVRDGKAWTPNNGRHWYNGDGTRYFGEDDGTVIVAEWPTEPKRYSSCEAAQVDVQREEYGPFGAAQPTTRKFTWLEEQVRSGRMSINDARRHVGLDSAPAIVARIDNGQPKPATRPYVHPNRASAEKEAARLAKANPGREFGVYEFVSSAKEERVYDYEWQRLAATTKPAPWAGDPAVSSLISLTGMSEKSATLAVGQFRREAA